MKYIIELTADSKGLQPAIDSLEEIGKVDKANAEQFKKTNQELNKINSSVDELSKGFKETGQAAVGAFGGKAIEEAGKQAQSFRGQLRQSRDELVKMMQSGQLSTAQIYKMARGAGELKDQVGDAQQAISVLASDTFKLDAALQGIQVGVAGFQVMQGAAALFGNENEELQKTLVKLNAVMAIGNGLKTIQDALQKQTALSLGYNIVAQKAYTFIVGESTGALKAFRLALAATGIGLAVIAIGALVANWDKLKESIFGASLNLEDFNKNLDKRKQLGQDYVSSYEKELKVQVLNGKMSKEVADQKLLDYKKQIAGQNLHLERYQKYVDDLKKSYGDDYEAARKRGDKKILDAEAALRKIKEQKNDELIDAKETEQKILDDQKEAADKAAKARKEAADKASAASKKAKEEELARQKQLLQDEIILAQIRVDELAGMGKDELNAKIELINKKAALSKFEAKSEVEKSFIEAKAVKDALELEIKYYEQYGKQAIETNALVDQNIINARLQTVRQGSQEEYDLKVELLENKLALDLYAIAKDKDYLEKKKALEIQFNTEVKALRKALLDDELNNSLDYFDAYAKQNISALNSIINDEKASNEDRKAAVEALANVNLNRIKIEKAANEDQFKSQAISEDDFMLKKQQLANDEVEITKQKNDKIDELNKKQREKEFEERKAIINEVFNEAKIVSDTVFKILNDNRNAEFDARIEQLNKEKEEELKNKDLSENQKARINERYERKIAEQKRKQAEENKKAAIAQALINGALAITNILATMNWATFGVAQAVAIASTVAATAAQVAVISAQKIPKFAKGTEFVNGAGTATSDSIPAMLSKGERVVPAHINKLLNGIPNEMLPDMLMPSKTMIGANMDYDKMAKAFSKELASNPQLMVNFDRRGFETFIKNGNTTQQVKNSRNDF